MPQVAEDEGEDAPLTVRHRQAAPRGEALRLVTREAAAWFGFTVNPLSIPFEEAFMNNSVMDRDICCQNFKGMIAYIRNHYGEQGVRDLLAGLTDNPRFLIRDKLDPSVIHPVRESQLTDPAYWVSNEFSLALFENVYKVVSTPNPLIEVGIGAVRESLSKCLLFAARLLGPEATARQAARINARFNKTKDVKLIDASDGSMSFELKYRPGFRVTKNVCHWNLGIYTEIARLTGVKNVEANETHCIVDGDKHCVFRLTWDPATWHRRLLRGLTNTFIRWMVRDLIEEYETTVHERDQLIDRLIRSEQKYRTLFEDSLDGMSLTTGGKIVDVNPAWLKIHGYTHKDDVIGMDVINVVHPEDRGILAAKRRAWPAVAERFYRLRDLRYDGSFLDVEVYSFQIIVGGEVSILTTVRDITELKRTEEAQRQLEARIKRAEKMEALGTLAGGVAHDLNNILSGIVGYPDLLLMQLPPGDRAIREPVETIKESGLKAAAVVQDLLTLARRGVASNKIVNMNRVIEEYLKSPEFDKLKAYYPHAEIETRLSPGLMNISGSPVHLAKTVMNLVINAAEAMPEGGLISIRTENVYVDRPIAGYDEIREGDYVVLTIADTGIGIEAEDKEKIFEPFYTKKVMGRSGTGLGMAVVWGAVKDHNGYINLESAIGKGSRFTIYLPATDREAFISDSPIDLQSIRGKGEAVLIVDDIAEQRELAKRMLTYLGYEATVVSSGERAVAALRDRSFALVLLDMIMEPGMDGLDTYRKILELRPGQRAIIASGYSETDRVKEAQRLGAGAYLKKPYTVEMVATAVRRELDR
ncbi:MAG: PAS domain S-box protein [Deltaproteobacteria bacterium]|nr:PAS domain S-box protein [Deltaproteobacteria bacterium]